MRASLELLSVVGRRVWRRRHQSGWVATHHDSLGEAPGGGTGERSKAERLEVVLAGMSDGVMMIDADLRLVEWNAHFPEFTGVPPEMLRVGLPMEEILRVQAAAGEFGDVDVEAEVARRIALLRAGGSSGTIERKRPNGRVMELRRNPLPEGGFVTLYTDVTARRQAEEQLRQAQKMEAVGHLTGGVAHDFNNLLMIILGNLEITERSLKGSDMQRALRGIEVARSGARRAASLTQRLLAFSRRQPREPQPINPNALITNLSDLIRQSAASNIVVELALVGQPWLTLADPNQFEIAVLNLVINSRDAMPKGGVVTIETANVTRGTLGDPHSVPVPGDEFVQITVRDNGSGMPPEVAERACEPFFTTKGAGKGTGLGLFQVVDFATQAAGHVRIDSEPGSGTAVTIYLPRLAADEPVEGTSSGPGDISSFAGRGEAILVVENEPDILAYTTEGLEALGYRVLGAQDASSALTLLEGTPDIAILFTDLGLPGIDGQQLAREAKRRWPGLPILYTSGGPEDASAGDGTLGPGGDYLVKPYALPKLARMIRAVLDARLAIRTPDPA
jgi:signal transduction histidine kinase